MKMFPLDDFKFIMIPS